jgi:type IV pilus assembly protein PilB
VPSALQDPVTSPAADKRLTRRKSRLGEILVQNGAITQNQLDQALAEQAARRLPIGKVLLKLGFISDETMRQALSEQLGVPFIDLDACTVDRTLARVVNRTYARRYSLIPVARVGQTLTVAMDDPTAKPVVDELTRLTGFTITVVTASSAAIERASKTLYDAPSQTDTPSEPRVNPGVPVRPASHSAGDEIVSQRADEMFHQLLVRAVEVNCSDVHLETHPSGLHIRFRIDGVLRKPPIGALQRALDANRREVISRVKILSKLDIAERRRPQDGSFQTSIVRGGKPFTVDMRISVVPTYHGESVVIRILDRTRAPRSIEELDLAPVVVARLHEVLDRTTGIFLVTGPTGSGKSTTLGACLRKLHQPEVRVLTAEDPVEYIYDALSQSEVNDVIGNTFAAYLRAFLRHDPEVIMVGEIRDEETAEMSFRAAQTGHLLLSTLHTNSAIAALPRLLDLNIESSLVASSLIGVMSQRLARKICEQCREDDRPTLELLNAFFQEVPPGFRFFRGAGCEACGHTGYSGRMIIADLWVPDEKDMLLIARQAPFDDIRHSAQRTTFSMAQDVHERLCQGRTTLEELLRVLPYSAIAEHRVRFSA